MTKTPFESLFSKYSIKNYELPNHLFDIIKSKPTKKYKFSCKHIDVLGEIFTNDLITIWNGGKKISICRPRKNRKFPQTYFYIEYEYNTVKGRIIEISPELQFLIVLKARSR